MTNARTPFTRMKRETDSSWKPAMEPSYKSRRYERLVMSSDGIIVFFSIIYIMR